MGEVVNVLVAFAVIVFVFKWATSGKDTTTEGRSPAALLGFRPKQITQEQVDTIHGMFPDIPSDNIRYDLLRTGNVELTSNKILERGFLPAPPPAYYTLYPRPTEATAPQATPTAKVPPAPKPKETLITRYHLEKRISDTEPPQAGSSATDAAHVWQENAEKREASLRERKAKMILAARERLLAQQRQQTSTAEAGPSS
ncbi:hypothetical protein NM688_g8820 [Phlebia brevispora]|uniref:Uncharacterized protein n=1 Tax=Phlebia brevispora TaxID=194682 RepID=A0ACC1RNZ6_9APHY|nr:hypothetical protein NM688_g8820 [Phlebia brevispora]